MTVGAGTKHSAQLGAETAPRTLGEALRRNASASPASLAIVSSVYDPLTHGQLAAQIDHFAGALCNAGFGHDARVGIALKDGPRAAVAIVSVACSAVAVPLDPNLTSVEINTRLGLLGLDAAIVLAGDTSPVRDGAEAHGITIIEAAPKTEREVSLSLVAPEAPPAPLSTLESSATAFILQSSGTTADPKLVPYSHANMLASAARVKGWFELDKGDRCLSISPAYYSHGLKLTVFTPLLAGGSVAFPKSLSLVDLAEWFVSLKPTWFSASPTAHRAILDKAQAQEGERIGHNVRFALSGGAPLPGEIQAGMQSILGVPVLEHYGTTETAQISTNLLPPGPAKVGTCGMPDPNFVMIEGENGKRLGRGEWGEILVGGPTVTAGYLDAPESNKAAFADGWFRTGDIGSIDEEGFLVLGGRLKEIINRGGEKISPMEIEAALLRHPDVAEAAAFPVPHPRLGEDVAACVVLQPRARATPEELRQFLSTQLAWFKVPRRVRILEDLPKGKTGKVQRRKLSEGYR